MLILFSFVEVIIFKGSRLAQFCRKGGAMVMGQDAICPAFRNTSRSAPEASVIHPKHPASKTDREKRLSKAYSFPLDLQGTANRLLFKSCSPVKMLKIKLLYSDDNRNCDDPRRDHFGKNRYGRRVNVLEEDLAVDDRPPGMSPRSAPPCSQWRSNQGSLV